MRLSPGMPAPDFATERLGGGRLSLAELRGREVLLKFYRFAECPICNLHLRGFVMRHEEVAATPTADTGLTTVVVFHSPLAPIARQYEHELPFVVLADPEKRIFRAYGVEESWRGMFSGRVARDYARATAAGYFSRPLGHDGGIKGHPADFLIDGEGIIRFAHYGRSYADSLGVDEILSLAGELWIGTPGPAPAEVAAAAPGAPR